jgi:hypothetical protein
MNDKSSKLGDLLAGQESENHRAQTDYRKMVRDLMERKIHGLSRVFWGLIALAGVVFCVSLVVELFESNIGNHEVAFIVKFSMAVLFLCVLFYTNLAARIAIRGKVRPGGTPAAIFGASVMAGFFACLWLFLIFILPKLVQMFSGKPDNPVTDKTVEFFIANLWIGTTFMLLMIAFFGVVTAGISILIHLQHCHFSAQRQKLLEIELAVANLTEEIQSK